MKKLKNLLYKVPNVLGSRRFYWLVLIFFVLESAWIALSARYPQAFDEDFHFGLIRTYSHYWLPFLNHQPAGANAYGAVPRDPSYLYHYLLSFPYRLLALWVHSQTVQVIVLRFLNIVLFGIGLVLFRRLLRRVGLSPALTNLSLALLILIPITPQLAGQINYDNLLMPLVAIVALLACRLLDRLRARKPSLKLTVGLLSLCLLTSLVKYEFLPIFLAIFIVLIVAAWRTYKGPGGWFGQWLAEWRRLRPGWQLLLIVVLLVSAGMFLQRDGYNLVAYHTLAPKCDQVLDTNRCSAYPVWYHDYNAHQQVLNRTLVVHPNPFAYLGEWIYWLWYRLFFVINGPPRFVNYPPLPLPAAAFALLVIAAVVFIVKYWGKLLNANPYVPLMLTIVLVYMAVLLGEGYLKYHETGVLELMNGRYLLPIVLPAAAVAGQAFRRAFKRHPGWKMGLAVLALLMFFDGGGVFSFVVRSDPGWDINKTAVHVNNTARNVVTPFTFDGPKSYSTSLWFFN